MFCAPKNMFPKQTNKKLRKEKKKDKKKKNMTRICGSPAGERIMC